MELDEALAILNGVICEEWHQHKPKQECPICHETYCGNCDNDPMQAFDESYCPVCQLNLLEE
jgi:hypothetical protein